MICIDMLEDSDDDALVTKVKIQKLPYAFEWRHFKDAAPAIEYYKQLILELGPSTPLPPNRLILIDLKLRQSHGFEFLNFMRSGDPRLAHVPIIVITASDSKEDVRGTFRGGATNFLKKPFSLQEFMGTFQSLIVTGRLNPSYVGDKPTP